MFYTFLIRKRSQNIVISRFFNYSCNNLADSVDQDQTARSVLPDLDLHCPQNNLTWFQHCKGQTVRTTHFAITSCGFQEVLILRNPA